MDVTCTMCGKPFKMPPSRRARTKEPMCSYQCNGRRRAEALVQHSHKGKAGWTDASRASYATKMTGAANPAWKGGVTVMRTHGNYAGVRYVRAPAWALPMARKDGYVMEHRLMAATMAGRLLTRTEVVHHRDHDPTNNVRTNLEVWPTNASHKSAEWGRIVPGVANRV